MPAASPIVVTSGCGLPPGRGTGLDCPTTSPEFLSDFERAMDTVGRERGLVDIENFYRVDNKDAYVRAMVEQLRAQGFCAFFDGAEFAIKKSNSLQRAIRRCHVHRLRATRRQGLQGHLHPRLVGDSLTGGATCTQTRWRGSRRTWTCLRNLTTLVRCYALVKTPEREERGRYARGAPPLSP